MTVRGIAVPVAALAAVASFAALSQADAGTASGGRVAFVRYSAKIGHPRIFVVDAGGGRARALRLPTAAAQSPAWSRDGKRLAFVGGANEVGRRDISNGELYVLTTRGGAVRRLTRNRALETSASWSPDGTRLVFVRTPRSGTRSSLFVTRVDGRGTRRLTAGTRVDTEPSWSRKGWIAFLRIDPNVFQSAIWLVHPNGTGLRRILTDEGVLTNPVWSPDGSRLLVQAGRQLVTLRPDGSERRLVTTLATDARGTMADPQPAWSPDGKHIVYTQLRPRSYGISDVWVVAAQGGEQHRLTRSPELDSDPSWGG
jgi:TolB protein